MDRIPKPSEIVLWRGILPLIDTFRRAELEMAAAIMVRACVRNGDAWQPLTPKMLGESMTADLDEDENWKTINRNPFAPHPDVRGLVAAGFAAFIGDPDEGAPVHFTRDGVDKLAKRAPASARRRAFAVAVYLVHAGRVLLIKHKRLGLWLPVGGEIEPGETPQEAAVRETREETGLRIAYPRTVEDTAPIGFLGYEEHGSGEKGLHMCFHFKAEVDTDEIVGDGSFTDHKWVNHLEPIPEPSKDKIGGFVNRALWSVHRG